MSTRPRHGANPFASPIKATASSTPQPDVLSTADLLLEQLKELENFCSAVEERVQRKRRALTELEYLILGPDAADESPRSPVNTPARSRLHLVSPRLRGLFDLHGPGQANLDATQSCLDYSPEIQTAMSEDPDYSDEWVDEAAPLCPFDDKYVSRGSPRTEKAVPAIPQEKASQPIGSKIPRKVYVQRQVSSRRLAGRSGTVTQSPTHRRRQNSLCGIKPTGANLDPTVNGAMRRASWKRGILENVKPGAGRKTSPAAENDSYAKYGTCRKEKRKGLWSIYSVCSELGLNGTHTA